MKKEKISIIVPIYNVECYIKRCLDSLAVQTHTNLEILCINDGSTDGSGEVCDEYAEQDERFKVFHQMNRGVSAARNIGIRNSTGIYIGFVDPDDWIEPNMYAELHQLMVNKKVAVGVVNYCIDTDMETIPIENREYISENVIHPNDMLIYAFKKDCYKGFSQIVCNKLFLSTVIKENNVFFDEKSKYGEDSLFYAQVITAGKCTGVYCDDSLYHYYQRSSSVSNFAPIKNGNDALYTYGKIIKILVDNNYKKESIWVKRFYCYFASVYAELALKEREVSIYANMCNEIQRYLPEYIETNEEFPDRIERIYKLMENNCLEGV